MPYLYNTPDDQRAMLEAIGAGSIEDLFAMIPGDLRLKRELEIPPALTEIELTQHMTALAAKNAHAGSKVCFLGGGSYDHFVPAVVDEIAGRGEFYTSYTPYQAEVSQGNLAGRVRVPDADRPAHRPRRLERQPLRRRQRRGRGGADGGELDRPVWQSGRPREFASRVSADDRHVPARILASSW